jgi:hypothetical protein
VLSKFVWPRSSCTTCRFWVLYSLRWTFVSLARASGEVPFNVSRIIGHARSTIVDTIYAHTVESGVAGVSDSVAERAGLTVAPRPEPPKPIAPSDRPKLRVIDGGRPPPRSGNQPDVRKPIENVPDGTPKEGTSD